MGNTDARSEVKLAEPKSVEDFLRVFIPPTGFDVDDFLGGRKSYVYGLKGIGKPRSCCMSPSKRKLPILLILSTSEVSSPKRIESI